jgi:hypothetical protein
MDPDGIALERKGLLLGAHMSSSIPSVPALAADASHVEKPALHACDAPPRAVQVLTRRHLLRVSTGVRAGNIKDQGVKE